MIVKYVLEQWDCRLDIGKSQLEIGKYDMVVPFTESKVPVVDILDVTSDQLHKQWKSIPEYYKLSSPKQTKPLIQPPPGLECFVMEQE